MHILYHAKNLIPQFIRQKFTILLKDKTLFSLSTKRIPSMMILNIQWLDYGNKKKKSTHKY